MSQVRIFKLLFDSLPELCRPISGSGSELSSSLLRRFSSTSGGGGGGRSGPTRDNGFSPENTKFNVPEPIAGRPLRGERPMRNKRPLPQQSHRRSQQNNQTRSREGGGGSPNLHQPGNDRFPDKFAKMRNFDFGDDIDGGEEKLVKEKNSSKSSAPEFLRKEKKSDDSSETSFLDKFKLRFDKREEAKECETEQLVEENGNGDPVDPSEDADEIFREMKETGLIPNAVAMLDGLCKDGLVHESMKLFGWMREKGTMPEVIIYTAVVEGYCKVHKVDDAKKVFVKMKVNGIMPNAYSYSVLVQGLCKCEELEDAIGFCEEMLESGHSPNVATFVGLVDGVCQKKDVEEARNVIEVLRKKGFFLDEKAVREYLDRRGLFNSKVWEAIFGTTTSKRPL